ncbi:MAG: class D beta-lactamase [Ignavibacteriaceae bacterium]
MKNDWAEYYKNYKGEACFILYDLNNDKYYIYNEERINKGFHPASTFKIFNSLAALEAGVIKDENEIIKWDGVKRWADSWNQDQDMRSAFKYSAVWFYQELARRIGEEKMQQFIDKTGYGNKNIQDKIDYFWLSGELRITPMEQIEFLKRLYKNDLPFSQRSIDIVKDIMIYEKTDEYTLRAKTGWSQSDKDNGWWVGYVETTDNVFFFVNNMDIVNDGDEKGRIEVSKKILSDLMIFHNP